MTQDATPEMADDAKRRAGEKRSEPSFREVIAYLNGIADAVSAYDRRATSRPSPDVSLVVIPRSRRVTLPYGGPHASTFAEEEVERGSGTRLRSVALSADLYELAGVEQSG